MHEKLAVFMILISLLGLPLNVSANELNFGTKVSGMGGAGVALTQDVYASYWNPAGLTRIDRFSIAPNLAFFSDNPSLIENWSDYFQGQEEPSEPVQISTGAIAGFATPRFAINMLGKASFSAVPAQNGPGQGEALVVYNSKVSMAGPISLGSRTLSVGGTFNYYSAHQYLAELPVEGGQEVSLLDNEVYTGQGQSLDLGLQLDLSESWRLGLTARNLVANYDWDNDHSLAGLQPVTPSYQAGLAWERPSFRAALDWEWNQENLRRYHLGVAKDFLKIFTLRLGGVIQPEVDPIYTGGLSLHLGAFSLNLAGNYQDPAWSGTVSMAINM